MKWNLTLALALIIRLVGPPAGAYPLDSAEDTGITRLEAYRLAATHAMKGRFLPTGALLRSRSIRLRLLEHSDFQIPSPDAQLSQRLKELLGSDAAGYGIALLDVTDPDRPLYAGFNAQRVQSPGSVGKIIVALGWFQAMADVYPDDVKARRRILFHTPVVANGFIIRDEHDVPFWKPGDTRVEQRPLAEGDRANLWTYFDWMCSSSSNAAASMLMSHLVLLKHFGKDYPVSEQRAAEFFEKTSKTELQRIFLDAIQGPVRRAGINLDQLRQGSFFTREGKRRVPGTNSVATARELLQFAVLMEQGKLVDRFSSLEIKRLLYLTERRIRYASHPALDDSAVFFKSGSLYSCRAEPGFDCGKYRGNVKNYMNSLAVIETTERKPRLNYMVAVLSNVLRKNSADVHQTLAMRIHRMIEAFHPESGAGPRGPERERPSVPTGEEAPITTSSGE